MTTFGVIEHTNHFVFVHQMHEQGVIVTISLQRVLVYEFSSLIASRYSFFSVLFLEYLFCCHICTFQEISPVTILFIE